MLKLLLFVVKNSALVPSSALSRASLRAAVEIDNQWLPAGCNGGQGRALIKRVAAGADSADATIQLELSAVRQSLTLTRASGRGV